MRFDKLVKMAGANGMLVEYDGRKYLWYGRMLARIPEGITGLVCAQVTALSESAIRVMETGEAEIAQLTDAFLPYANDKPSELRRVFSTELGGHIAITNKMFGLIEKHDEISIVSAVINDVMLPAAIRIGWQDAEADAWIFEGEFWSELRRLEVQKNEVQ